MSERPWRREDGGVRLFVHVQPGARREGAVGMHGGALKIAVRARAKEGEANEALVRWLARALGVARRDVELVRGATGRRKEILVHGDAAALEARLRALV